METSSTAIATEGKFCTKKEMLWVTTPANGGPQIWLVDYSPNSRSFQPRRTCIQHRWGILEVSMYHVLCCSMTCSKLDPLRSTSRRIICQTNTSRSGKPPIFDRKINERKGEISITKWNKSSEGTGSLMGFFYIAIPKYISTKLSIAKMILGDLPHLDDTQSSKSWCNPMPWVLTSQRWESWKVSPEIGESLTMVGKSASPGDTLW